MSAPCVYYQDSDTALWHGRWQDVPPSALEADVLVTDPPYGTGGWRRLEPGAGSDPSGTLVVEPWDDGALDWLRFFGPRVQAVLTFWPPARTSLLLNAANEVGLTKHRCLYWQKPDPKPQVGGRTAWSMEPVWCLSRDGFLLYGGTDVWRQSSPRRGQAQCTGHPYQKPLHLMHWLLTKLRVGSVCDPFAGSGTTLRAAKDAGMRAVGVEEDQRWCSVTVGRLRQAVLPLDGPEQSQVTPIALPLELAPTGSRP